MEKPKEEQEKEQLQKEKQEQKEQLEAEQQLEEKTEGRLQTVLRDELPLSEAEPKDESDSSTPESDKKDSAEKDDDPDGPTPAEKEEEAKLEAEEKEKQGDEDSKEVTDETKKEDTPQLPDAYYRAAKHNDWSDEEIKSFFESNPDLALKTFGNMLEAVNRSSQDFSAIGRARKEQFAKKDDVQPEKKESEFKGVDIDALRQEGIDEATLEKIKVQNEQAKANYDENQRLKSKPDTRLTATEETERRAILREADAIAQTVDGFFNGDGIKTSYGEFYGVVPKDASDWKDLTPGQKANRLAVVEMMDEILIGAAACGRELSTEDALRRAHLSITDSMREKVIRDGLKSKAKQRSKGITLEPTSTAQPTDTKPRTKAELETVTQDRLNKVFN